MVSLFGLLTPPTTFGAGTVASVGGKLKEFGVTKALVVCDQSISGLGYDQKVVDSLQGSGIEAIVFNEAAMDAPQAIIEKGYAITQEQKIDGVVGIGGGSCMDTAKGIAIQMGNPDVPFAELFKMWVPYNPAKNLVLIPTTSGTGSESTLVAVVTNKETGVKGGVRAGAKHAIIDPELVLGLPASITAYTGMDVFAHAAESLTAGHRNPYADILAVDAIKRVIKWLPLACEEPFNLEAREQMALASNFAGVAFTNAGTHAGHAIAHALGATYHIPHGIGCALEIPECVKLEAQLLPEKVAMIGRAMGLCLDTVDNEYIGEYVANAIRKFNRLVGIPSLKSLGRTKEDIVDGCFDYLMTEPLCNNSPVKITEEVAKQILADIYDRYQ